MAQLDLRRAPVKAAPATVNGTEVDSHLRVTSWSNSGNSFTVSGTYTPPNTSISEVFVRRKDRKPVSIQAVQVNSNGGNWSASRPAPAKRYLSDRRHWGRGRNLDQNDPGYSGRNVRGYKTSL